MLPVSNNLQDHSHPEVMMVDVVNADQFNLSRNGNVLPNDFSTPRTDGSEPSIATPEDGVMPIAIVGMSCRFPGGSNSPAKLWDMLATGRSGWSKVPAERFAHSSFFHPSSDMTGTVSLLAFAYSIHLLIFASSIPEERTF